MIPFEKNIAPLIEQQFPSFYREESPLFIAFTKAYYEWMSNNFQELILEDVSNFNVGDTVTQNGTIGKIVSVKNNSIFIENNEFNFFDCNRFCDNSTILTSSSGGTSIVLGEKKSNPLYFARRLSEIRDVDTTLDTFILQFKKQFLPNIQFTTVSNKELFIKNSLDFYRAKGTERAVDLFFKLINGFEANVYYPGDDIFRPSDNEWVNVRYLEIEPNEKNINFVGQVIHGTLSGANAYAERLIRVKKGAHFITVLFISNVEGDFRTGEQIETRDLSTNVTTKIHGSLAFLEVMTSDSGFIIGEDVKIITGSGRDGRARISDVRETQGSIDFELLSGGWGYTANAQILSSDRMLRVNDITNENTEFYFLNDTAEQFETIRQDLIEVEVANDVFSVGESVELKDPFDEVVVSGTILTVDNTTPSNTILIINYFTDVPLGGNVLDLVPYNELSLEPFPLTLDSIAVIQSNTETSNTITVIDVSATANVIGTNRTIEITYDSNNDVLSAGDLVAQDVTINGITREIANGVIVETRQNANLTYTSTIQYDTGFFRTNLNIRRTSDAASINAISFANTLVGVVNPINTFYNSATIYGVNSGLSGVLSGNFTYENEANIRITGYSDVSTLEYAYSSDTIDTVDSGQTINSIDYNLSLSASAGYANIIADATSFTNLSIGSVSLIVETSLGEGYPVDPIFIVYEPKSYHLERYDYEILYDGPSTYRLDEIVIGVTSGAKARIYEIDFTRKVLYATRISIASNGTSEEDLLVGEILQGQGTNTTTTIVDVKERRRHARTGLNAIIQSDAQSGQGFATQLNIVDSGYGYVNGEIVTLTSINDSSKTLTARVYLGTAGVGEGYHLNRKSFLSSDKFIQDSDYYQEYSYEILTALPFEVYKETLVKVLHVAGTKPFGSYVSTSQSEIGVSIDSDAEQMIEPEIEEFSVISITPNTGSAGGGTDVVITGTGFDPMSPVNITFGIQSPLEPTIANTTTITTEAPFNEAGVVTVTVTQGNNVGTLVDGFTYV